MKNKYLSTLSYDFGEKGEWIFYLWMKSTGCPDIYLDWKHNDENVHPDNYLGTDLKVFDTSLNRWINVDAKWWNSIKIAGTVDIEFEKHKFPTLELFPTKDGWKEWDKWPTTAKKILGVLLRPNDNLYGSCLCNHGIFDDNYSAEVLAYGDPSTNKFYFINLNKEFKDFCKKGLFPIFIKPTISNNGEWTVSYFYDIPLQDIKSNGFIRKEIIIPDEVFTKLEELKMKGVVSQINQGAF